MDACGYLVTIATDVAVDRLGAYSAALPPIYRAHGGRYLAMGGPGRGAEPQEGAPPRSVMIARFPSLQSVHAFWQSPAYVAAKPLRAGCGTFAVYAAEGVAPPDECATLLVTEGPQSGRALLARLAANNIIEGVPPAPLFTISAFAAPPPDAGLQGYLLSRIKDLRP